MSKGLRALKRIKDFLVLNTKHWKQDVSYIEKELKVLEIIKEKKVNTQALIEMSLREYNDFCNYVWITPILTQEEYDLLREVLL